MGTRKRKDGQRKKDRDRGVQVEMCGGRPLEISHAYTLIHTNTQHLSWGYLPG